jgi:hypothetical protein
VRPRKMDTNGSEEKRPREWRTRRSNSPVRGLTQEEGSSKSSSSKWEGSDRSGRSRSRDHDHDRSSSRDGDKYLDRNRDHAAEHSSGPGSKFGHTNDVSKSRQESTGYHHNDNHHNGKERGAGQETREGHGRLQEQSRGNRSRSRSRELPPYANRDKPLERKTVNQGRSWQEGGHNSDLDACRINEKKPWVQDAVIGKNNSQIGSIQAPASDKLSRDQGSSSGIQHQDADLGKGGPSHQKQNPAANDSAHSSLKAPMSKLSSTEALQLLASESQPGTQEGHHADPSHSSVAVQSKKPEDAHKSSAEGAHLKSSHKQLPSAQQGWLIEEVDAGCAVWQGRLGKASSDGGQVILCGWLCIISRF